MKSRVVSVLLAIACLAGARSAAAQVRVPFDYPTIQNAINAVVAGQQPDGTVIEVQPGTYREALRIAGTSRSLTIRGVAGSAATVVDASPTGQTALQVLVARGTVRIEGLTFTGGVGQSGVGGGGFTFQESSPQLVDVTFASNRSMDGGGGVIFKSSPTFSHCDIRGNTADRFGGGVVIVTGSRPTFTDCRIRDNVAGAGGPGTGNIGMGGGVHANDSSPIFRGCVISGNRAKFAAGGIVVIGLYDSAYGPATLLLEDTEVSNNVAERYSPGENPAEGGGVHIEDNTTAYLVRARILNNSANTGGGLNAYRARYEITGSTIEGNHAPDPMNVGGFGGGIGITSNNVTNPLRPAGSLVLSDSVVRGNDARIGGGILITGDQVCVSSCGPTATRASVTIADSVIADNVASVQVGGLRVDRVDLTITGSHVLRNTVGSSGQSFGGGLLLGTKTAATIDGTTIARNTSVNFGGGLFIDGGSSIVLRNSRVYANASGSGGGLYAGDATGTVQANVIADNSGYQIHEQACSPRVPTLLAYVNNVITPTSGSSDLYLSTCGGAYTTISALNASPGMRSSGNTSTAPAFVSFLATPDTGPSVLSWVVSRASNVTLSSLPPFAGDTGITAVNPSSPTTYSLTSTGGPSGASTATVRGATTWGAPTDVPVAGDFDGDGRRDIAVYRPAAFTWYILGSSAGYMQVGWGGVGDVPAPADYDGDGRTDIAIFRPRTGQWFIRFSGGGQSIVAWGSGPAGDVPMPRDYDGDGKADIAVYRTTTGEWFIWRSTGGMTALGWGAPSLGDVPVPADYDGDGRADIAVYRTSSGVWYRALSGGGSSAGVAWGAPDASGAGDVPVPADYDGDGKADIAVARASTGDWYVLKSGGGSISKRAGFGDARLPGNFEGSAAAEIVIFRAATGSWFVAP